MLAAQPDRGLRLAQEPRVHVGPAAGVGGQDLDRQLLAEVKVRDPQDDAHAAAAEHALDAVLLQQHRTGPEALLHDLASD
jgi:hypothetical protein